MKILSAKQIRELDAYTIKHEPIPSIELMERAARAFVKWFVKAFPDNNRHVHIFCGPGNNGGDGLAVARMLSREFYEVSAYVLKIGTATSSDFQTNLKNLKKHRCNILEIDEGTAWPSWDSNEILIDAIFGSGLNRPIEGYWAHFIEHLNLQPGTRIAIDIPSGMYADCFTNGASFNAHHTFCFELPKLGFFFPENYHRVGEWHCESIGLSQTFIEQTNTPWNYLREADIKPILKKRGKYDHKGTFGHALIIAGSYGKIGAAVLSAKACLRTGAGLVTVLAPRCGNNILQTALPEVMVYPCQDEENLSSMEVKFSYSAAGVGCGLGTEKHTAEALEGFLSGTENPIVVDADALNILAANQSLLPKLPKESILTPHPKEFERLFGATSDSFQRNKIQIEKARELGVYVILKGAYTAIACPDGTCFFNSTGNPGMATAGSGDVLTGVLTGLLAQGYSPFHVSILGVYLHGLAGDLGANVLQEEAMIAGDIINYLGQGFKKLKE